MTQRELARLYDDQAQALYALALNVLRNETEARDVLQEVFIKIARTPWILDGVRQERAFLLTMTYRLVLDACRRRATRERHENDYASSTPLFAPVSDPDAALFSQAMDEALAELPEEQRAVAHLKLWENWTFEAIADALGISPNTAASRYRYALDKLRSQLRPIHEEL